MKDPIALTAGIDLGGTSIRIGIYDGNSILGEVSMPTMVLDGPEAAVQRMMECLRSLLNRLGLQPGTLAGIGIGSPGPINLRDGILGFLPNLPGWEAYPLREKLERATGCRVVLESDANAAAVAEWKRGAGLSTKVSSLVMLTLGTGVGSGFIFEGKVWHGILGMGGEAGHASIHPNGWLCPCGTQGCLEMYASAKGIRRLAVQVAENRETSRLRPMLDAAESESFPEQLSVLAMSGDTDALDVYQRFGHHLGLGVANLVNQLDPPLIVIGGGVALAWPHFAPSLFDALERYSYVYRLSRPGQRQTPETDRLFVCPAQLGPAAGLIGAALLPILV